MLAPCFNIQPVRLKNLTWLLFALGAAPAVAQSTAPSNPAPLIPVYRSAFDTYKPDAEQGVAAWRDSNDTAARIGGWRAYARESRPAAQAAPGSAPQPAAGAASQLGVKP